MKISGESQYSSEVTRSMPLLTITVIIDIGTMNVGTIWETGNTSQIATKMRRYNSAVFGKSETHWNDVGQKG